MTRRRGVNDKPFLHRSICAQSKELATENPRVGYPPKSAGFIRGQNSQQNRSIAQTPAFCLYSQLHEPPGEASTREARLDWSL